MPDNLLVELQEAANVGNWLEARLHLAFTEIADMMFGDGRLTRDERKALSGAIGAGLDAFNVVVAADIPQLYTRGRWDDAPKDAAAPMTERAARGPAPAVEGDLPPGYVPLIEGAVRRDGTVALKLIEPGWGSSGYYPPEVLKRDGPKVFTKGTKQFWNHPTMQQEAERPEGDLRDLAAELIGDARYEENGPKGPGLYADAKVFGPYQAAIDELAEHIGVSIRASGPVQQGTVGGRTGPVVQGITAAKSVDYVTAPGAGGRIVQLFEAARQPAPENAAQGGLSESEDDVTEQEFQEAVCRLDEQMQAANTRGDQLEQDNARLREALLLRDARDIVRRELAQGTLPDVTQARLTESLSANPPVKDGALDRAALTQRIQEASKAEAEYLTQAAGWGMGRIEGMGGNGPTDTELQEAKAVDERMSQGFARLGLNESGVKHAVAGRG